MYKIFSGLKAGIFTLRKIFPSLNSSPPLKWSGFSSRAYKKVVFVFAGCALFFSTLLVLSFFNLLTSQYTSDKILSPIPNFFLRTFDNNNSKLWRPNIQKFFLSNSIGPKVTAKSAIAYDLTDNKLLYAKEIYDRLPFASLTKIMTATVALETFTKDADIEVTKEAAEIGEDAMGLSAGEKLKLSDLLYGLMLHSGNDAAEAIAQASPMGRDDFVYLMNKKAEELGLSNTHFTNPTGLEGDGNQYSTAYDILVMTRNALKNEKFTEVAKTVEYEIPYSEDHKAFYLYNETNLLTSYPGVKGVKTGFTNEAGLCLVTYLEYRGHKIIGVLLNSESRRSEMAEILDYSLKSLGVTPPPHS